MSLGGQWIGRYQGTNQGTLVADFDEVDDHFEGIACAWDDNPALASSAVSFSTTSRSTAQRLENLPLSTVHATGRALTAAEWADLGRRGIIFPATATVDFRLSETNELVVNWTTAIGGSCSATVTRSTAADGSTLQPLKIDIWREFKEYVSSIERNRFIYRGQSDSKWRLRSNFHRTGRANLRIFEGNDIAGLHKYLSPLTRNRFDLKDPAQNLAFMNLVQHHGYPTPLLDWTKSRYAGAFFAYRTVDVKKISPDATVRIFKLDGQEWSKINRFMIGLSPVPPLVVIMDALPLDNPRAIPHQALCTVTSVDDIESHIEKEAMKNGKKIIEVIDLPMSARKEVISDLSLMGITAGSLFPGIDGACEAAREQNLMSRY
jgi:FRG domain